MILCPNCNNPFEEKAGKLFCKEHGWHGLNNAGEIIPATEPTAEEIAAAAEKQAASDQPAKDQEPGTAGQPSADPLLPPDTEPVQAIRADQPAICMAYDDKVFYIFMVVAGLAVLGILGYTWYQAKQQRKAAILCN